MYRSRAFVTLIIALTAIVLSDISLNEEKKSMESIKKLKKKNFIDHEPSQCDFPIGSR